MRGFLGLVFALTGTLLLGAHLGGTAPDGLTHATLFMGMAWLFWFGERS